MNDVGDRPDTLPDGDLARRIAAERGSTAHEAELVRRFTHRIRRFGLRHLRSDDRARDLVQDVLVVTLEKLRSGEVRDPDRIGSFILGVARRLSHASHRDRDRHPAIDDEVSSRLTIDDALPDPLARDQVARCLEALHDRLRAVILLTYYAERSTREIASTLGLTANNVRVMRHRGMGSLRTCLGLEPDGASR